MKKLLVILLCLVFFSSIVSTCDAATKQMVPKIKEGSGMEKVYVDDSPVVISKGKNNTLIAAGLKKVKYFTLHILCRNLSDKSIDMNPTDISVIAIDKKGKETKVKVYSAKQIVSGIKKRMALSNGLMAAGSTPSRSPKNFSGTTDNGSTFSGSIDVYEDNTAQQLVTQKKIEANSAKVNATEEGCLKRNTVFPNESVEGDVHLKYRKAVKYIVTIPFGEDIHIIEFVPENT